MRAHLDWIPAFVVGAAAATTASVAVALLLYSGEGMLRSLTLIVAVELVALGVGLAGPSSLAWPAAVESLRRRWLAVLVSFAAAAAFAVAWTFGEGFGADQGGQAIGLALLAGLPLYACGRLLGLIVVLRPPARQARSGASAVLGAAVGVLATGLSGLSRLGAPSLLLFFLVLLSGTAMAHGWILEGARAGRLADLSGTEAP